MGFQKLTVSHLPGWVAVVLLTPVVLSLAACHDSEPLAVTPPWVSTGAVPSAGTLTYRYEWGVEGVQFSPSEGTWSVQTDLGYEVVVERGYVVSASVQLTECEQHAGVMGRFWESLGLIPRARAGHGGRRNPAAITQGVTESLVSLTDREAGSAHALSASYCGVHYLVAPGDAATRFLPENPQMVDRTLYVEGRWRAPGSSEWVAFVVDTSLNWGILTKLYPPGLYQYEGEERVVDTSKGGALVVVRRNAAWLFDGIDFQGLTEKQLSTRLLNAFFEATEIAVFVSVS